MEKYEKIKKQMLNSEKYLSSIATKSKEAIRFNDLEEKKDIRLEYAHDIDRIIHSLSYTRYMDKTQVFSYLNDDQISRRITHVQFVSRASRTIARALGLNEDLCEAISLGHDIGHVPFGHEGEYILNDISIKQTGKIFAHNVQSVRNFLNIEKCGKGINLTIQTLDGILCHNGEFVSDQYRPRKVNLESISEDFLKIYNSCYEDSKNIKKLVPMTIEGCVVRISDIIGYIGKDIEDAIMLGKFERDSIPKHVVDVLGNNNVDIMNNIILDVITNSAGKDYITMSDAVYMAVKELKKFNFDNIYSKSLSKEELKNVTNMFNKLFFYYLEMVEKNNKQSDIYTSFLNNMNDVYVKNTTNKRKVIDYIAGMTDRYMCQMYDKNIKGR